MSRRGGHIGMVAGAGAEGALWQPLRVMAARLVIASRGRRMLRRKAPREFHQS